MRSIKSYATITAAYWGFTLTDGALRMLVVLYFHQIGYSALAIASLFLFYEVFGIVTNLVGGWLAARFGLNKTLFSGLILQVLALYLLSLENHLSVIYVMAVQALSGIAKDLNKMSAKSSLKLLLPEGETNLLFKWVAILTGSKNTLKGIGFFLGGFLLTLFGYQNALLVMAYCLAFIGLICFILLPTDLSAKKTKVKFKHLFAKSQQINFLSAARFFLFGARDIWFVVALPVYLQSSLNWTHSQIGLMMAIWIIIYGLVQSMTPKIPALQKQTPTSNTSKNALLFLFVVPILMVLANQAGFSISLIIIIGLLAFAVLFAINSAIHSYLILNFSDKDNIALDVGFYYMANAAGRLFGTLMSGLIFQIFGFIACIIGSGLMILVSYLITRKIKNNE